MKDEEMQHSHRTVIMSEMMTPNMVNFQGNVHGGYILALLDRVAYACAARYCGSNVVTLSVDQVVFKQPIHVGELVVCYAMVNHVGTTSVEVGIKVMAENLMTRQSRHTNTCYFTMVAVDEAGKPIPAPPLRPITDLEKRRYHAAIQRKEMRLAMRQKKKQKS